MFSEPLPKTVFMRSRNLSNIYLVVISTALYKMPLSKEYKRAKNPKVACAHVTYVTH